MKRILIIGCPGAGKSFLSKQLGKILNLPVVHLDCLYWKSDKTCISQDELIDKMLPYLKEEKWIIDGNYHLSLRKRLEHATDVFFLKMPREVCVKGIRDRIGQKRDDIPWVESPKDAEALIEWTKNYEARNRAEEEALLEEFKDVNVHVFYTREEVNIYLEKLKNQVIK